MAVASAAADVFGHRRRDDARGQRGLERSTLALQLLLFQDPEKILDGFGIHADGPVLSGLDRPAEKKKKKVRWSPAEISFFFFPLQDQRPAAIRCGRFVFLFSCRKTALQGSPTIGHEQCQPSVGRCCEPIERSPLGLAWKRRSDWSAQHGLFTMWLPLPIAHAWCVCEIVARLAPDVSPTSGALSTFPPPSATP